MWGKATETGETPLRTEERKGQIAELPHSLQLLERGVHMDRTRECFGADIPNLVVEETESRASTTPTPHHHRDPAKIFSIKNRNGRDTTANPKKSRVGITKLTSAS